MKPRAKPRKPRQDIEGPIHVTVLQYLRLVLPKPNMIHHSPNEINLSGYKIANAIRKATKMGTVTGWPDLEFVYQGRVYFIEVKAPKGRQSPDQTAVETGLNASGAPYAIVRGIDDTKAALIEWGLIK